MADRAGQAGGEALIRTTQWRVYTREVDAHWEQSGFHGLTSFSTHQSGTSRGMFVATDSDGAYVFAGCWLMGPS